MAESPIEPEIQQLTDEDGGGFFASRPAMKGCWGHGETIEEALADFRLAAAEWLDEANRIKI